MPGYSGLPLFKKLGFKPGWRIRTIGAPSHYPSLLGADASLIQLSTRRLKEPEAIHWFVKSVDAIEAKLPDVRQQMGDTSMLWVSWPKGKSAGITREDVRSTLLKTDLVDVKVCAVDDEWSGLKFVIRKSSRS